MTQRWPTYGLVAGHPLPKCSLKAPASLAQSGDVSVPRYLPGKVEANVPDQTQQVATAYARPRRRLVSTDEGGTDERLSDHR